MDSRTLSGAPLAYYGDAVFELLTRGALLEKGLTVPKDLNKAALHYVTATAQSEAYGRIEGHLSEEELEAYKRGRNAHGISAPKSAETADYRRATGLEALFGWLWLNGKEERAKELFGLAFAHEDKTVKGRTKDMYRIGIDFGGTNIAVGLVDSDKKVVYKRSMPTKMGKRPVDEMVDDMALLCREMAEKAGGMEKVGSIGIASPGVVNTKTGEVEYYCGMNLNHYPMAKKLSERLDGFSPIYMENDANAAAYGEVLAGAAQGAQNAVMITLGTGVGGGIIINGKIYDGFNFAAAELGHIVIEKDGVPCACGRRGCWEKYSSATGLIRMTKEEMEKSPDSAMWEACGALENVTGRTAYDAAKKDDEAALRVVAKYQDYLAVGLANIVNIFQPEILIIGGGVCGEGDYLLNPVNAQVMEEQYAKTSARKTKLVIAALGNDAGIVGAAFLGA